MKSQEISVFKPHLASTSNTSSKKEYSNPRKKPDVHKQQKEITQERKQANNGKRSSGCEKNPPKRKKNTIFSWFSRLKMRTFKMNGKKMTKNYTKSISRSSSSTEGGLVDREESREDERVDEKRAPPTHTSKEGIRFFSPPKSRFGQLITPPHPAHPPIPHSRNRKRVDFFSYYFSLVSNYNLTCIVK